VKRPSNMGKRQNTTVCAFDPRISAYEIHEWIYEQLKLEDNEVLTFWRRNYFFLNFNTSCI